MAQVNWFFWVVVVFLFLWMIALVLVTYMTFCFPCIGCTAEGDIFCYRFKGRSRRSDIVNESLITKTVERHDIHIQQNVNNQENDQLESGGTGSENDENVTSQPMCSICLNSFHIGEKVSWARHNTACCHAYHPDCILPWLNEHSNCPCCREMFLDYHDLFVNFIWRSKRRSQWLEKRALINTMRERGTFCATHGLEFELSDSQQTQSPDVEFPIQIPNQSLPE